MARTAGLDVDRIAKAALAVADRDGLDKLTMRRLSAELGVTPMATYHHVSGKDELLDLVIDESIGQLPVVDPEKGDVPAIVDWFLHLHRMLLEHPSLAAATAGRRIDGPQAARAAIALTKLAARISGDADRAAEMVVAAFWLALGAGRHRASREPSSLDRSAATTADNKLREKILAQSVAADQFRRSLAVLVDGYLSPRTWSTEDTSATPKTSEAGLATGPQVGAHGT